MPEPTTATSRHDPSRRQALLLIVGSLAALAMGACTPATIVLKAYPEEYRPGSDATDNALESFVDTVVPGLTPAEARAVTVLRDPFYPMAKYADFLASDLDRRAWKRYRRAFHALARAQRTAVIQGAFAGDTTTRKLYTGAVYLTQAAVYGGIQDDRAGCRLIGFPGGYRLPAAADLSYGDARMFRAAGTSRDGNPA